HAVDGQMATYYGGSGNEAATYGGTSIDKMYGGGGADSLFAGDGADSLFGGTGNDSVDGGAGDDVVSGERGQDAAFGGTGADGVVGGDGRDTLYGGTGNDWLGGEGFYIENMASYASGGSTAATFTFTNATDGAVDFVWIDGTGQLILYATLQAGQTVVQQTFVGHNWLLRAPDGLFLDVISVTATSFAYSYGAGGTEDSLFGGDGNDTLEGMYGADTLSGELGFDTLYGGTGNDSLSGGSDADALYGDQGNDTLFGGVGNDTLFGGTGSDALYGDAGHDLLWGGTGAASLFGGDNEDTLYAGDSNDSAYGGFGYDLIFGGNGDDLVSGEADSDTLHGDAGSDSIYGGGGADFAYGGIGNDAIYAGDGADFAYGGDGNDKIGDWGTDGGNDTFFGGAGNDSIFGGSGDDSVSGDAGDDTLSGGAGTDTVYGGIGTDIFYVTDDHGFDTYYGGEELGDNDLIAFSNYLGTAGVNVTYIGNEAANYDYLGSNDAVGSFAEVEGMAGTSYADAVDAGATTGGVTVYGHAGHDTLKGGSGGDRLDGGADNDSLAGGAGADSLTGGAGADVFEIGVAGGHDQVTDFDMTVVNGRTVDQIDVSDLLNTNGGPLSWHDITITEAAPPGSGNALLTFPGGESLVLQGVNPRSISGKATLARMGMPCFAGGTPILTPEGWRAVETLQAGAQVVTRGGVAMPVLWAGGRAIAAQELTARPGLMPVRIAAGALGNAVALSVSQQHAVLMRTGAGDEVLARAGHLARAGYRGLRIARNARRISYHHILLPQHAVIDAGGAALETLYPGPEALLALGPVALVAAARAISAARVVRPAAYALQDCAALYGPRLRPLLSRADVARRVGQGWLYPVADSDAVPCRAA
ncbi:MAG: Hint domain-containing protein, partial [Paracoccaceae bacterium]